MSTITGSQHQLTTVAAIKSAHAHADEGSTEASSVVISDTEQVSAATTVTTLVLTSANSHMPNLSLSDLLEHSGVDDQAQVLLETDTSTASDGTALHKAVVAAQTQDSTEAVQEAVEAIESAEAIVVEIETTNNVQSVTVRAADINTLYTQAVVESPMQSVTGESNILLLHNGWAYTRLQNSPLELPLEPPEGQIPNTWARWRSVAEGVHEIQDAISGTWNRIVGKVVDTSPKTPADMAGVFKSYSEDHQLLYTRSSTTTLTLSAEGIFTNSRTTLTTSSSLLPQVSYGIHTMSSSKGSSSTFSGRSEISGGLSAVVTSNNRLSEVASDMFGAYRMLEDGVTLEMQYADGSIERKLFLKTQQGALTVDKREYVRHGNVSFDFLDDLMSTLVASGDSDRRHEWMRILVKAMKDAGGQTVDAAKAHRHSDNDHSKAEPVDRHHRPSNQPAINALSPGATARST